MAPSSERQLLRPSVEARVQLDRVELLCVAAESICGCQRWLIQDGIPEVVAPSRRPDRDVTHSLPIAAFYPPSHAGGGLPTSTSSPLPIDCAPVATSRPSETRTRDLGFHRSGGGNRVASTFACGKELNIPDWPDVVLLSGSVSPHLVPVNRSSCGHAWEPRSAEDLNARPSADSTRSARTGDQA